MHLNKLSSQDGKRKAGSIVIIKIQANSFSEYTNLWGCFSLNYSLLDVGALFLFNPQILVCNRYR